jgi:hypothetical protein
VAVVISSEQNKLKVSVVSWQVNREFIQYKDLCFILYGHVIESRYRCKWNLI